MERVRSLILLAKNNCSRLWSQSHKINFVDVDVSLCVLFYFRSKLLVANRSSAPDRNLGWILFIYFIGLAPGHDDWDYWSEISCKYYVWFSISVTVSRYVTNSVITKKIECHFFFQFGESLEKKICTIII